MCIKCAGAKANKWAVADAFHMNARNMLKQIIRRIRFISTLRDDF
jgi:hypothetical protein